MKDTHFHYKRKETNHHEKMKKSYEVFISSIAAHATERDISRFVSSFGKFSNLDFTKKPGDLNNNTAVVSFKKKFAFNKILSSQPHFIQGVEMKIRKLAKGKKLIRIEQSISTRRLYVKNIPFGATQDDLVSLFSIFGEIELCYVCKAKRKSSSITDYGFITFKNPQDAQGLLEEESVFFKKFNITLHIKSFNPKGGNPKGKNNNKNKRFVRNKTNRKSSSRAKFGHDGQKSSRASEKNSSDQVYESNRPKFGPPRMRNPELRREAAYQFSRLVGHKDQKIGAYSKISLRTSIKVRNNHYGNNLRFNDYL